MNNSIQIIKSVIVASKIKLIAIYLYLMIIYSHQIIKIIALIISRGHEKVTTNTYMTTMVNSKVSALINNGLNTFDTLSKLGIPDIAKIKNIEI